MLRHLSWFLILGLAASAVGQSAAGESDPLLGGESAEALPEGDVTARALLDKLDLDKEVRRLARRALKSARRDPVVALCHWSSAQILDPRLNQADLSGPPWTAETLTRPLPDGDEQQTSADRPDGQFRRPVKTHGAQPRYSAATRRRGIQGGVMLQVIIDEKGRVTSVQILKSLHPELDRATIEAMCRWRFEPATINGVPVAVYYNLTMSFSLQL